MERLEQLVRLQLNNQGTDWEGASRRQLYEAVSRAAMEEALPRWNRNGNGKTACYLSAEFLLGRMIYSNLLNLGRLEEFRELFQGKRLDPGMFEEVEDAALGNGGLGRLAACFLDSAATAGLPLDGYGIRYRYGLFRQYFQDGFQQEEADDWTRFGDPWSIRRVGDRVRVDFGGESVWAVPYDMPVIGYGGHRVNTLRLWQAEAVRGFDFSAFNRLELDAAVHAQTRAEALSAVLYPNDATDAGRRLRLRQQYFLASATVQDLLRRCRGMGKNPRELPSHFAVQLNDTHPTIAIPELIRLLVEEEGLQWREAKEIAFQVFAYTNHTVMPEALEKWDVSILASETPLVYPYIVMLNNALREELAGEHLTPKEQDKLLLVQGGRVHMARLAVCATHATNGVAEIHTSILKERVLKEWHERYPQRFSNKTNGITPRRWLLLCNPGLSGFITERIGDGWITDLSRLSELRKYADDHASLERLLQIRRENKERLAGHVRLHDYGFRLDLDAMLDVQVKRLHEYKRQLLNAFSILDIYFRLKEGELQGFRPMTFLFGAKAAPGYRRAKGIIKYINEIARLVNGDPAMKGVLQVLFVQNYNVSYAEKIIPAADLSEQISTAGTEASGTGNMKLALNGAPTIGTWDGANIEIARETGADNNYLFGARVEELEALAESYHPRGIYEKDAVIRRAVDTLVDGTLDDGGTGLFRELYTSLLQGASWHPADHYYLLHDFPAYQEARLRANRDYGNPNLFARKCLLNIAGAGFFSSDRTVREYAREIWGL